MRNLLIVFTVSVLIAAQLPLRAQTSAMAEEQKLIAVLQSDKSPREKDMACARLKRIGTEASIPALAALLTDEQLSHSARYALESMPFDKAGQALLEALAKTKGSNQAGIINSLGERQEKSATQPLEKFLTDTDAIVAAAAAEALGKIGGIGAELSLESARPASTGPVRLAVDDALLRCANALHDHDEFLKLTQSEEAESVRIAAFRGMIQTAGVRAPQFIVEGISGKDVAMQTAALEVGREMNSTDVTPALVVLLPRVSPPMQIAIVGALAQRGDVGATSGILSLAAQASGDVRLACINALDELGDVSTVPFLAEMSVSGDAAEKKAARAALLNLRQDGITAALLRQMNTSKPAEQMELARALGERGDASAVPELLTMASTVAESPKAASLQALALLAASSNLPAMVDLVANARDDDSRSAAADALNSALQRLQTTTSNLDLSPVTQAMQSGSAEAKMALLPVCSGLSSDASRQVLRSAVADKDARVSDAAIRALCETHDPKLLDDLAAVISKRHADNIGELAVRGAMRLLTEENSPFSNERKVTFCKALCEQGLTTAELRSVLAGLGTIHDNKAIEFALMMSPTNSEVRKEGIQAAEAATAHQFRKIKLTDQFWDEGANFADFNHDGKMDVVSGLFWYEGPAFTKRHEYRPAKASFEMPKPGGGNMRIPGFVGALGTNNAYSDDFLTFTYDFNNDGWPDILVIDFPGKAASWYENPKGAQGHWKKHEVAETVDNESPTFLDINGDGKPEIVCNAKGYFGYYAPSNWNEAVSEPWAFHPITPKGSWQKFTHGLGVGDVNGDGKMDLLEKDGWWEQPASLAGDPVWTFHPFPFAPGGGTHGAAQMFAYDVNGDGLNDVITSLDPHGYGLVWWEQKREGTNITFKEHVIMGKDEQSSPFGVHFTQAHSMALADIDGDGLLDIVTGKRYWAHGPHGPDPESDDFPAVLYWFQLVRVPGGGVEFVPHIIDSDSGVGTQVVVGNIVNTNMPDIVVGNKKGTFVFIHEVKP